MKNLRLIPMILLTLALTGGCDEDKRLVKLAQEADQRQAEQNQEIARQNHQIAEATKQLVEADAKSRQEMVALERDLQSERAEVGRQRDVLENDRRKLAAQRHRESVFAAIISTGGITLACLLPLILAGYLLHGLRNTGNDDALGELLTIELTAASPLLLRPSNESTQASERLLTNTVIRPAITSAHDDTELPF